MNRTQWRNLWRSFRWMRRRASVRESIAWCGTYGQFNAAVLRRVVNGQAAAACQRLETVSRRAGRPLRLGRPARTNP
jgi:hypothetical protein